MEQQTGLDRLGQAEKIEFAKTPKLLLSNETLLFLQAFDLSVVPEPDGKVEVKYVN